MGATLLGIDVFTTQAFRGNPAAVCLLETELDDDRLQAIAAEMNLSETAFVLPRGDGFGLRWFTPTQEVLLCGHATIASAWALWETGGVGTDAPVRFRTRWKGELVASRVGDAIAVDFPAAPLTPVPVPDGLADVLGADPVAVGTNDLHHVVEVADESTVRGLRIDPDALARVDVEAIAVTAASDDPAFDFVSRYFAPRHGIVEDPVTGSAHTGLGPWWAGRLGKTSLVGHQVSAREGVVHVTIGPQAGRVTITGDAVTIWRGELRV
jgi:predicted PhzF superfamily epimerase YddE/YHI9